MNVILQGTRIELTDDVRALVDDKLEDCLRPLGDTSLEPVTVNIEVELTTRRHPQERETEQLYRSEATVSVPGRVIRAEGTGPSLKRAVVQMKRKLTGEIRDWRNKVIDDSREGARFAKDEWGVAPAT